jgi:hypothetical protein
VRDPAQRELVRIARRSADSLGEFVSNVLDLSKDESGRMALEPQPDDLAALVRDVTGGFALFAAERGNMLTFQQHGPVPACLRLDAMRVRQIVANLISNALKFTEGGRIAVLLAARRRPAGDPWCEVQITVSDDGIGITPEQQRRLFEPYAQFATGSASRFGGIGLGLAICKRLAESMAGSIRIRSEWRKGTSATVRLMLGVCGFEGAGTPDRRPPRVLIACCDRVQQVLLTTTLRRVGLDADLAVDAGEALERWHDRRHDLVLLDCDADPAAVRVLARRLLHEGLPAQRLVGLSAAAGAGVAGQAGIATVLPRPASAAQLWQAIASALRPQSAPAAGSGRGRCQTPTDEPTTQEVCFGR